jgi:hypothetical protein
MTRFIIDGVVHSMEKKLVKLTDDQWSYEIAQTPAMK